MTDSELRAAIDEVPLEVTLRGITTHLVPEDPGNPELESKRDSTMVEIMELLNNALTTERTAIKAAIEAKKRQLLEPVTNKPISKIGEAVTIDLDADRKGSLVFIQDNGYNQALTEVTQVIDGREGV